MKMHNPLPKYAREIVFGSLFGDGGIYLTTNSRHYHYMECHSPKQREYIEWKHGALLPVMTNGIKSRTHFHSIRKKMYTTLCINSINHSYFTRLRGYFYPEGKKKVSRWLLNKLTDVGLAVWFMDDGTTSRNNRGYPQMCLCTCSYSVEENQIISDYFRDRWGIETRVHRKKTHPTIYFNKPNSIKLIKIIRPYILPCMQYKLRYFSQTSSAEKSVEDIV